MNKLVVKLYMGDTLDLNVIEPVKIEIKAEVDQDSAGDELIPHLVLSISEPAVNDKSTYSYETVADIFEESYKSLQEMAYQFSAIIEKSPDTLIRPLHHEDQVHFNRLVSNLRLLMRNESKFHDELSDLVDSLDSPVTKLVLGPKFS